MPTYGPSPQLSPSPSGLVAMELAPASRSPRDGGTDSDLGSPRTMRPPGSVPSMWPGAQRCPMGPEGYQGAHKPPCDTSPGPVLVLRPVADSSAESLKGWQGERDPCVSLQPQSLGWAPSGSSVLPNKQRSEAPQALVGSSGHAWREWTEDTAHPPGLQPSTLGSCVLGGCSSSPPLWARRLAHRSRSGANCTQLPPLPTSPGAHLSRVLLAGGHAVENPQVTALWGYPRVPHGPCGHLQGSKGPGHSSRCAYSLSCFPQP